MRVAARQRRCRHQTRRLRKCRGNRFVDMSIPPVCLVLNWVPETVRYGPNGPFAYDEWSETTRLSVCKHARASVGRGDQVTHISPTHAHAPPPLPRGGTPTVDAARACVRCDDAQRIGCGPQRPSGSIHARKVANLIVRLPEHQSNSGALLRWQQLGDPPIGVIGVIAEQNSTWR